MQRSTIFHNPNCGTSRKVLALIRNSGEEPEVIEYLKTPPSTAKIRAILTALNIGAVKSMNKRDRNDFLEELLATTSPEYLESIKDARADYKAGRVKTHDEVFGY